MVSVQVKTEHSFCTGFLINTYCMALGLYSAVSLCSSKSEPKFTSKAECSKNKPKKFLYTACSEATQPFEIRLFYTHMHTHMHTHVHTVSVPLVVIFSPINSSIWAKHYFASCSMLTASVVLISLCVCVCGPWRLSCLLQSCWAFEGLG